MKAAVAVHTFLALISKVIAYCVKCLRFTARAGARQPSAEQVFALLWLKWCWRRHHQVLVLLGGLLTADVRQLRGVLLPSIFILFPVYDLLVQARNTLRCPEIEQR